MGLLQILGLDKFFQSEQRSTVPMSKTWDELLNAEQGYYMPFNGKDLSISAVYACIKVISETISTLPIKLYEKKGKGKTEAVNHKLQDLLMTEPNDFQTWVQFIEGLLVSALLDGNGYARIYRNGRGEPIRIQFLAKGECMPYHVKWNGYEYLSYFVFGQEVNKDDIIHITCLGNTGVIGLSPITLAATAIDTAFQAQNTINKFYQGGLRSSAVFTSPNVLQDTSFKRLKDQLKKQSESSFILLEGGTTATSLTLSPQDAEIISTRKFQIEDIARFFRVPLHKIGDLARSTNNNIEQQTTDFLTDCIMPWVEKIEQEFKRKLLFTKEKKTFVFNLDTSYLMRGDSKSRAEYYSKMFSCSAITPNEIRELEGYNPFEDENANKLYSQMQMVGLGSQNQQNTTQNVKN